MCGCVQAESGFHRFTRLRLIFGVARARRLGKWGPAIINPVLCIGEDSVTKQFLRVLPDQHTDSDHLLAVLHGGEGAVAAGKPVSSATTPDVIGSKARVSATN